MPKKNLKSTIQEDESERRPQQITLGCFIKEARPRKNKQSESDSNEQRKIQQDLAASSSAETTSVESREISTDGKKQQNIDYIKCTIDERDKTFAAECVAERQEEGFKVMRTKKGGYPIYLEKRAKGKKVTVVREVTGNSKVLLQTLKAKFGTGGLIKPGEVEIQGDFEEKLTKYFKENTHFLVQYKSKS